MHLPYPFDGVIAVFKASGELVLRCQPVLDTQDEYVNLSRQQATISIVCFQTTFDISTSMHVDEKRKIFLSFPVINSTSYLMPMASRYMDFEDRKSLFRYDWKTFTWHAIDSCSWRKAIWKLPIFSKALLLIAHSCGAGLHLSTADPECPSIDFLPCLNLANAVREML